MEDVKIFSSLMSISTYPFENHLKEIKMQVRPLNSSIEQISRRLAEISLDKKIITSILKCADLKCHLGRPYFTLV